MLWAFFIVENTEQFCVKLVVITGVTSSTGVVNQTVHTSNAQRRWLRQFCFKALSFIKVIKYGVCKVQFVQKVLNGLKKYNSMCTTYMISTHPNVHRWEFRNYLKYWPTILQWWSTSHLESVSSVRLCQGEAYCKQYNLYIPKRKSSSVWYGWARRPSQLLGKIPYRKSLVLEHECGGALSGWKTTYGCNNISTAYTSSWSMSRYLFKMRFWQDSHWRNVGENWKLYWHSLSNQRCKCGGVLIM